MSSQRKGPHLVLEADWLLPISGRPIASGAVAIDGDRIAAVGTAAELRARYGTMPPDSDLEWRSFPGCAILPGLINAHSHLDYSAFLGFSRPMGFGRWMLRLLLARRRLATADYALSAGWGAQECLRNGVTCVADTSFEGWTAARAAGEAGLRALVYLEVFGLDEGSVPEIMARTETRLSELESCAGPLIDLGLSPHAPYTVSWRLFREISRYAAREHLPIATHVAESAAEVEFLERGTGSIARAYRSARLLQGRRWTAPGLAPVAYLASAGTLGTTTLAVHCVHLQQDDIQVLAGTGTSVAHCPRSNDYLRCGIAPVVQMRASDVKVALGTDSLASNTSLDMFEEMRAALAASQSAAQLGSGTTAPLAPTDVLRMATIEAAGALGRAHDLGSLEAGKLADLMVLALPPRASLAGSGASTLAPGPPDNGSPDDVDVLEPLIVRKSRGRDVQATIVAGALVFERSRESLSEDSASLHGLEELRRKLGLDAMRHNL